ncbi:MAG TPA: hypothetical protein VJT71_15480, partial [Pyrinomonadaceae bacterium]|nr:hypothetical protein [Pyrinomonadaceae bacterium]
MSWTNICADAEALEVTFDAQTHFEDGFDFLHIVDSSGAELAGSPFTGDRLAGKTVFVRGNKVVLRLETDSAVSDWGFKVASIFVRRADPNPLTVARQDLTVFWEVQNQGAVTAPAPWYGGVYVSTNPAWSTAAIPIRRELVGEPLDSSANYSQITTLSVPNVGAGDYYLILRAEDEQQSTNELATPLRIENVDLAAIGLKAPASAAPQEQISVTWIATNRTSRAALPDWYDYLYIRQGPNSNFVDRVWRNATVPAGGTYSVKRTVTIPTVAAGTYDLEIQVNPRDLAETNLTNNLISVPISIVAADLVGVTAVIDGAVAGGEWFSAGFTVSNASSATAYGPWHDVVYLSRTNRLTAEAIQVAEAAQYDAVSPHTTYIQYFDLNLSADYTGDWFLLFQADGATNLSDGNMEDNVVAVPLRINAADLIPTSFRATIGGSTHLVASPQQT